jgi:hypothetical protein
MNPNVQNYQNRKRQEEILITGIKGYCSCCGATMYVDVIKNAHDTECIW